MEASSGVRGRAAKSRQDQPQTPTVPASRQSAAKVRREIIRVLAPDKSMTPAEIRSEVAQRLPTAERASIDEQIGALLEREDIACSDSDSGMIMLTDRGRRWSDGIDALAVGE